MPPKAGKHIPSHRGGGSQSNGQQSAAPKKKGTAKKKIDRPTEERAIEPKPEEEVQSIVTIVAPLQAIVDTLCSKIDELVKVVSDKQLETTAPSEELPEVPSDVAMKKRTGALRIWKNFAAQRLSEMASSLEAALANDSKLRDLFAKIDTDLGGSIDEDELFEAVKAAGKTISKEVVNEMFHAADYDGGGDIDYSEFADVIKGVKASKAAFILERGVRRHQAAAKRKVLLTKAELEAKLGQALLAKGSPKDMIREWDRSKKRGTISHLEFRQGVRFRFVLNYSNPDLDEWFGRFDSDKDGELNLAEVQDMFRWVSEYFQKTRQEASELSQQVEMRKGQLAEMKSQIEGIEKAMQASIDEDAKRLAYNALPHVDAAVGATLQAKIKSASNPKAVLSFDDVVSAWDIGRNKESFMDMAEFVSLVSTNMGQKKPPSLADLEATFQQLDVELNGQPKDAIQIKPALKSLLAAERTRITEETRLKESCRTLKAKALQAQESAKLLQPEFQRMLDPSSTPKLEAPAAESAGAGEAPQKRIASETETDPLLAKLAALDGTNAQAPPR